MRLLWISALTLIFLALLDNDCDAAKARTRTRGKSKRPGSPRFIFYTHPKMRAYYDNPNGAQIIKASHFDYEFFLGHKIVFVCVAKGDPLPHISWYKDGIELYSHPYLQISEWKVDNITMKSKLEIDPARQMDSGTYECQANNKYTVDGRAFKADFSTIT